MTCSVRVSTDGGVATDDTTQLALCVIVSFIKDSSVTGVSIIDLIDHAAAGVLTDGLIAGIGLPMGLTVLCGLSGIADITCGGVKTPPEGFHVLLFARHTIIKT